VRKVVTVVAVAAAAAGVASWAGASASSTGTQREVRYVRTAAGNAFFVDNDPSDNSGGDLFGSTGDLRHAGRKVGTYSSACTASSPAGGQCQATFVWSSDDRLQISGDYQIQAPRNVVPIVGGTGKFRKARGEAVLKPGNNQGSVQRVRLVILR
jgi:hypothetical protein